MSEQPETLLAYFRLSPVSDGDKTVALKLMRYKDSEVCGDGLWLQWTADFRGADWGPHEAKIKEILTFYGYIHNDTLEIHDTWMHEFQILDPEDDDTEISALSRIVAMEIRRVLNA